MTAICPVCGKEFTARVEGARRQQVHRREGQGMTAEKPDTIAGIVDEMRTRSREVKEAFGGRPDGVENMLDIWSNRIEIIMKMEREALKSMRDTAYREFCNLPYGEDDLEECLKDVMNICQSVLDAI